MFQQLNIFFSDSSRDASQECVSKVVSSSTHHLTKGGLSSNTTFMLDGNSSTAFFMSDLGQVKNTKKKVTHFESYKVDTAKL